VYAVSCPCPVYFSCRSCCTSRPQHWPHHLILLKAKACNTYIAPQAAYCSCSGGFVL